MQLQALLDFFEKVAPLHLQESYDNAGLITGNPEMEISGVITCLDSTEAVVKEAIELGSNVIVAHHPIIFSGLKSLTGANYIQRTIQMAIKHDIAIVAMHTNLDNVFQHGVNERIAKRLGLEDLQILRPKDPTEPQIGSGMIGELPSSIESMSFLKELKLKMGVNCIKYTQIHTPMIKKVAVAGGSGGFLLKDAIQQGADIFITADFKYHEFFDANDQIIIADIGHYESEQYTIELLSELINDNFVKFAARTTKMVTNPVNYL